VFEEVKKTTKGEGTRLGEKRKGGRERRYKNGCLNMRTNPNNTCVAR